MDQDGKGDIGRKFLRAAQQRMIAVDFLLRAKLNFEAVYLAGYVIECSLKAIVLANVPPKGRVQFAEAHFRGRAGHDFEVLKGALVTRGVHIPGSVSDQIRRATWSTDLRYQVGALRTEEAEKFISAARHVLHWAQRTF